MMIPHSKFKALHKYLSEMDDRHGLQLLGEIKSDFVDLVGQARQWEPIETAPINTPVLVFKVFESGEIQIAKAINRQYEDLEPWQKGWNTCDCKYALGVAKPTHWQPLPEAPQEEGS